MAERFDREAIALLTEQVVAHCSSIVRPGRSPAAELLRMAATLLDEGQTQFARSIAERAILALSVDAVSMQPEGQQSSEVERG